MGRVKSELFDWELDEDEPWPDYQRHLEIMDDPVVNEWNRKNFKESVEQQIKEREESDDRQDSRPNLHDS